MEPENNIAFIDGQNLYLGTQSEGWKVDLFKFRVFLRDKLHVQKAYYFLGCIHNDEQDLYDTIQEAGFIIKFREHNVKMTGKKKGNVDVDIAFEMMRLLIENKDFGKIVLVSGDGDYIRTVKYLISKNKFKRILFPNTKYSSLYKQIDDAYWLRLYESGLKNKIKKETL